MAIHSISFRVLAASGAVCAGMPAPGTALGQPATDLHGTAADGAPICLSQFRGKVILLAVSKPGSTVCEVSATALQHLFEVYGPEGWRSSPAWPRTAAAPPSPGPDCSSGRPPNP